MIILIIIKIIIFIIQIIILIIILNLFDPSLSRSECKARPTSFGPLLNTRPKILRSDCNIGPKSPRSGRQTLESRVWLLCLTQALEDWLSCLTRTPRVWQSCLTLVPECLASMSCPNAWGWQSCHAPVLKAWQPYHASAKFEHTILSSIILLMLNASYEKDNPTTTACLAIRIWKPRVQAPNSKALGLAGMIDTSV